MLSTNLIGLALGPTSVALASDYIFESTQAVGSSLSLVGAMVLPMAYGGLALEERPVSH